jgi:phosphatidate phosphatase APP1
MDSRILRTLATLSATVIGLLSVEPAGATLFLPGAAGGDPGGPPSREAASLKRDESILIFPGYARLATNSNQWEARIHVWVGELEPRRLALGALGRALGLATELDADEAAMFRERARWFLADNERGKRVSLRVGGQRIVVGPTSANGHAHVDVRLDQATPSDTLEPAAPSEAIEIALDPAGRDSVARGELHLLAETGLSVISDIDDTIKVTEVADRPAMLRNSFLKPFRAVSGMAELYQAWRTNEGAQFHYVSASPWQLYPALAEFRRANGFPAGTFHLKTFRWKDESFFDLFQSPVQYKLGVIEPLLAEFPRRRFRLVGDSGEADPEVYGELARRYPEQIELVLIRELSGATRESERYRFAFRDVPPEIWSLFGEPPEAAPPKPAAVPSHPGG